MKKCLVIGGGIAGLSAASVLSSNNIKVTLVEASPKLGGRTYSFQDYEYGDVIDNGQHILMGCYDYTMSLLKLIGAENNFIYQDNLKLVFIDEYKSVSKIDASKFFYPFNLLTAFINYEKITSLEKLRFFGLVIRLPLLSKKSLSNLTVNQWLKEENQSDNIIGSFWEILCVGAMNTSSDKASALLFHNILLKIFFGGNQASKIVLPKFGLSQSIIEPAFEYIRNNDGKINLSESVKEIKIQHQRVTAVLTEKNKYEDFDFVISAIPLYALEKIFRKESLDIKCEFQYPTILNIHIWLKDFKMDEEFFGLLNSQLHWIFNKGNHINVVVSDADELSSKSNDEIIQLVKSELYRFLGVKEDQIIRYKIIKEKRATFLPGVESNFSRPDAQTKIENLLLAGDWTNTGLPATIEGAAKSGFVAANIILKNLSSQK